MDIREAAEKFSTQYHQIYLGLYSRRKPSELGLTREALGVLEHLVQTGPITVGEAAKHFQRSQSATSELFDRLEARGFIERIADKADRRRKLIWLTERGLQDWRRDSEVLSREGLELALAKMAPDDRQSLVNLFKTLVTSVSTNPEEKR